MFTTIQRIGGALLCAASLAFGPGTAGADTPVTGIGGLALSPDGSNLVAVTNARALYVLDPDTLEIKRRVWIETSPVWVAYSADGEQIFVRDTKDTIRVFDATELRLAPIPWPMAEVAARLVGTVAYLFRAGPVLKDGETLGATEQERFRISVIDGQRSVRLVLESSSMSEATQ